MIEITGKTRKYRTFQSYLLEKLKDPEEAREYLNVALTDEDPRMFLIALKNVLQAIQPTARHK